MARRPTVHGSKTSHQQRPDGRKALLVYLDPEVIKALKKAAVDVERHGYEIVEEAVRKWLLDRENH
jgi:TPP-dependent indolepyruvate ferredoxin oxidoreductase alpha subunit